MIWGAPAGPARPPFVLGPLDVLAIDNAWLAHVPGARASEVAVPQALWQLRRRGSPALSAATAHLARRLVQAAQIS